MPQTRHTITDAEGNKVEVIVNPDRRLKKSARWTRAREGHVVLRVPYRMPQQNLEPLLADIAKKIARHKRLAARQSDEDLQQRAAQVNARYFGNELAWSSIRWVGNMHNRLGSCTNGGPTDGYIRISERIHDWPQWVIDYVIAHELAHRKHDNHSPEFWAYLRAAFPQTERAIGFIQGMAHANNEPINDGD